MNRYDQGKIYKLVNDVDEEFYIGSTCLSLAKRLWYHRKKAAERSGTMVYKHMLEIGKDNIQIVLIKDYPCANKNELVKAEREAIEELKPTLNKAIPGRTKKEYRNDHKEDIKVYNREYRKTHVEELKAKRKEYDAKRKELIL